MSVIDNRYYKGLMKLLYDKVPQVIQDMFNPPVNGIKDFLFFLFACLFVFAVWTKKKKDFIVSVHMAQRKFHAFLKS